MDAEAEPRRRLAREGVAAGGLAADPNAGWLVEDFARLLVDGRAEEFCRRPEGRPAS